MQAVLASDISYVPRNTCCSLMCHALDFHNSWLSSECSSNAGLSEIVKILKIHPIKVENTFLWWFGLNLLSGTPFCCWVK